MQVHGSIITPLKVSLSREQYEQLLDTTQRLFSMPPGQPPANKPPVARTLYYSDKFDLAVKVIFELPTFSVEFKQDCFEQPLVELSMRDFVAKYQKLDKGESTMQVSLRSLLMEDLLRPDGSRYRCMMHSSATTRARYPAGVSKSCPDLAYMQHWRCGSGLRGSLPDKLETDALYGVSNVTWQRYPMSIMDTPNTPPPSPGALTSEENLVFINITTTVPHEQNNLKQVQKTICVDFNCLDLVINVESWMVVLDFLGAEAAKDVPSTVVRTKSDEKAQTNECSETEIEVKSLNLVLTQTEREIAKANISNATMHIVKNNGKTKVSGSLGSMSLMDLTPHGRFYRERFLSSGKEALNFQYSSYSDSEKREHDASLKLHMSAVHYVHTQRFVAELQVFFGRFSQLRTIMANLRAGDGAIITNKRRTRLSLELHAGAPVILLPVSSRSNELVLLDLGELTAHNTFELSKIEENCLLDVMLLELVNMNVYAARRTEADSSNSDIESCTKIGGFIMQKMGPSLLTDKCHLKLKVERNLDSYICKTIPELLIRGTLSTMNCALDPAQYMLIRGLLSYNLGENLDDLKQFMQDFSDIVDDPDPNSCE